MPQKWAVLSARLGLGKGGVRMAPEEALGEVLQVGIFLEPIFNLAKIYHFL